MDFVGSETHQVLGEEEAYQGLDVGMLRYMKDWAGMCMKEWAGMVVIIARFGCDSQLWTLQHGVTAAGLEAHQGGHIGE